MIELGAQTSSLDGASFYSSHSADRATAEERVDNDWFLRAQPLQPWRLKA